MTHKLVLLTRLYGCVAKGRCNPLKSLPVGYRYFVSDYDLKQYVKTFFERPAVFVFLEHSQDFFRSQSVAQTVGRGFDLL